MRTNEATILTLAFFVSGVGAQQPTVRASDQIREVAAATRSLATPEAAHAAGFEPIFGWIPMMGTHYVNNARMAPGRAVKLAEPSQLMFSPINGRDSLVGAAYAYLAPLGDSSRPSSFDGNPNWHEHPNLAPEGQTLVMLHVWFVPSPDGPFSGHNHNLPFWALGLEPPNAARLHDPAAARRFRKTALALAEVADSAGQFPVLAARESARGRLRHLRDSVRALLPELSGAGRAGDWDGWDRVADRAALLWDSMKAAYLDAVLVPDRRVRVQRAIEELEYPLAHRH